MTNQPPKKPGRMSMAPVEERKPSKIIGALVWLAFIIPIIILWFAFQSWQMVAVIVALRILLMGLEHMGRQKKAREAKPAPNAHNSGKAQQNQPCINKQETIIYPFVEEAKEEVSWLLEKIRFRNGKEEKHLEIYRKLRGWE